MSLSALLPAVAHAQAQTAATGKTFAQIVQDVFVPIGDSIIALLYLLAFLMFLWGVVKFFLAGSSEESRARGKQFMLWGIIGLAVLFGVWGAVKLLLSTLMTWK